MSELSQSEADALLHMEKRAVETQVYRLPGPGARLNVPLESLDKRESFYLDLSRGRIDLRRYTLQSRARQAIVLARLDFGAPHRNPDGEEVGVPHLHIYREAFGVKWAMPVPPEHFSDPSNYVETLKQFMNFCWIVQRPLFEEGFV